MRKRSMLLVEDDVVHLQKATQVLESRGWRVDTAEDGNRALERLVGGDGSYDVVVLDLKMPNCNGEEVLEYVQDHQLKAPPIIVLSAYLDEIVRQKCAYLGAACVLEKPYNPANLSDIAAAVSAGAEQLAKVEFNEGLLDYMVRRREESLRHVLSVSPAYGTQFAKACEPLLVVARRWNSWYPSIFPVIGGSYVVVGASVGADNELTESNMRAALIDPGFQFMRALTDIGLPWQSLDTCVITHNHPDHLAGIFEFMAARHAMGKRTRVLCSASCSSMLGDCSGYNMELKEIDEAALDLVPAYELNETWRRVRVRGFDTAHEEIGRQNSSKGLRILCETGRSKSELSEATALVIVGDTEYDRSQHRDKLIPLICKSNVKVVVLHIGGSQLKQGTGKHLYLPGLRNILADMESHLHTTLYQGQLLVLVSEWGLEHATLSQIEKICGYPVPGFNQFSPIIETLKFLQKGLAKIVLLPADVGLVVGLESGNIHLKDGSLEQPLAVDSKITDDGITYCRRISD